MRHFRTIDCCLLPWTVCRLCPARLCVLCREGRSLKLKLKWQSPLFSWHEINYSRLLFCLGHLSPPFESQSGEDAAQHIRSRINNNAAHLVRKFIYYVAECCCSKSDRGSPRPTTGNRVFTSKWGATTKSHIHIRWNWKYIKIDHKFIFFP